MRWLGSNFFLLPTVGITGSKIDCRKKKEIKFDYKEGVQEIKKGGSFEYRFTKIANWN